MRSMACVCTWAASAVAIWAETDGVPVAAALARYCCKRCMAVAAMMPMMAISIIGVATVPAPPKHINGANGYAIRWRLGLRKVSGFFQLINAATRLARYGWLAVYHFMKDRS